MVLMAMSLEGEERTHLIAFSSLASATALGLRSPMPVRSAAIGRLFRTRAATAASRGASTSIRVATARASTAATSGSLFALSKGSSNSERM